jgi:hypothetical protein
MQLIWSVFLHRSFDFASILPNSGFAYVRIDA